jgi:hypothetical protein
MSILSYNQINELFNQVAIAHYQIKRFGSGELSEADINKFISDNQEYPVLWMTPVSVTTNSNVLLYSLNLLVFDLVNKDKDNEEDSSIISLLHQPNKTEYFYNFLAVSYKTGQMKECTDIFDLQIKVVDL